MDDLKTRVQKILFDFILFIHVVICKHNIHHANQEYNLYHSNIIHSTCISGKNFRCKILLYIFSSLYKQSSCTAKNFQIPKKLL